MNPENWFALLLRSKNHPLAIPTSDMNKLDAVGGDFTTAAAAEGRGTPWLGRRHLSPDRRLLVAFQARGRGRSGGKFVPLGRILRSLYIDNNEEQKEDPEAYVLEFDSCSYASINESIAFHG